MNKQTISIFLTSLACITYPLKGNEELKYPAGATDLVPDQRFEQFKDPKFDTLTFKVKVEDIVWDKEIIEGLNEYQFDYPSEVIELKLENEKLKKEISDLKQRVSKLEALLNPKSEPADADNPVNPPGNSKKQLDD